MAAICLLSETCCTSRPSILEAAACQSSGQPERGSCGALSGAAPLPCTAAAAADLAGPTSLMPTSVGGPPPTSSRQGRDKQRYTDDGARLVAGCIPVRFRSGEGRLEDVEVLLITSRGGKGWVFPKGGWEDDESVEAAAKRETVEEAGVRGTIEHPKVGEFSFQSNKQARLGNARGGRCVAHIFVMVVGEELEAWPEHPQRQRRWMPLTEASAACRHAWMRDALHTWAHSKGWELPVDPALQAARTESGALSVDGLGSPLGSPA